MIANVRSSPTTSRNVTTMSWNPCSMYNDYDQHDMNITLILSINITTTTTTITATTIDYYFCFMAIFPGEPGSVSSFSEILLLHLFHQRTSGISWTDVLPVTRPSMSKQWGKHNTDPNQRPGLILSSSTIGLLTEGYCSFMLDLRCTMYMSVIKSISVNHDIVPVKNPKLPSTCTGC